MFILMSIIQLYNNFFQPYLYCQAFRLLSGFFSLQMVQFSSVLILCVSHPTGEITSRENIFMVSNYFKNCPSRIYSLSGNVYQGSFHYNLDNIGSYLEKQISALITREKHYIQFVNCWVVLFFFLFSDHFFCELPFVH